MFTIEDQVLGNYSTVGILRNVSDVIEISEQLGGLRNQASEYQVQDQPGLILLNQELSL